MHAFTWQFGDDEGNEVYLYLIDVLIVRTNIVAGGSVELRMLLAGNADEAQERALNMTDTLIRAGFRLTGPVYAAELTDAQADALRRYLDNDPDAITMKMLLADLGGRWERVT